MLVTEVGIVRDPVNPEQPLNALIPMLVTEPGIVRDPVNFEEPANALVPMLVKELGSVRDPAKLTQLAKAVFPMLVTEFGIDTLVTAAQERNAFAPIAVIVRPAALATPVILRNGAIFALLAGAGPMITPFVTVNRTGVPVAPKLSVPLLIVYPTVRFYFKTASRSVTL